MAFMNDRSMGLSTNSRLDSKQNNYIQSNEKNKSEIRLKNSSSNNYND